MSEEQREQAVYRTRLLQAVNALGLFVEVEDGTVFLDAHPTVGFLNSRALRWIAEELDRRNEALEEKIDNDLRGNVLPFDPCPKCGTPMKEDKDTILTTCPPKVKMDCPQCKHVGYREIMEDECDES